jgi:hypothetical protein
MTLDCLILTRKMLSMIVENGQKELLTLRTVRLQQSRLKSMSESQDSIFDLFNKVRDHPDFVFGAVFTKHDLPDSVRPSDDVKKRAEEAMVRVGFEVLDEIVR